MFASRLGPVDQWQVEWKYDGIRGQVVKRAGKVWVWSRGEELVTERFPEIEALAQALPDGTVLDGEIMVWQDEPGPRDGILAGGRPAPFSLLQQRIGRKTLTKKVLAEAPVTFMAYDLLEQDGRDIRALSQGERRARLEALLEGTALQAFAGGSRTAPGRRSRSGASARASSAWKASCSSAWTRPTAPDAPRPKACGGSGRSSR